MAHDPLPITSEGVRIISEEATTMMRIVARYKPAEHGGEAMAYDNYEQMAHDVIHLSALLASVQPYVGECEGEEQLADYARKIGRDHAAVEYRKAKAEAKVSDAEAERHANVQEKELFRDHGHALKTASKLRNMVYGARGMIDTLNKALDRMARERNTR